MIKPREFWIEDNPDLLVAWSLPVSDKCIHVIEYSAYQALAEKCERYEEALRFYAELMDWDRVNNPACIQDKGKVARQALKGGGDEKNN